MSELHAVQETRGSKCVSIWEKQSGGLFRSEYSIAPLNPYKKSTVPTNGAFCLFFYCAHLTRTARAAV